MVSLGSTLASWFVGSKRTSASGISASLVTFTSRRVVAITLPAPLSTSNTIEYVSCSAGKLKLPVANVPFTVSKTGLIPLMLALTVSSVASSLVLAATCKAMGVPLLR